MSTYYLQPFIWAPTANHTLPSFYWNVYSNEQRIKYLCMCVDDLMKYQTEAGVKEAGRLRLEGKEYVVQDGDIMHFRFNV